MCVCVCLCVCVGGFPGGASSKETACQFKKCHRSPGSVPESIGYPEGGYGNLLQYFWLENTMDRGTWQAMVHRVRAGHNRSDLTCICICVCVCVCVCVYMCVYIYEGSWCLLVLFGHSYFLDNV